MANKTVIQIGDTFRTIKDTMHIFGKETGDGIKPCYYNFESQDIAIWFPVKAHENNGVLEKPPKNKWLNILSKDEKDITEILLEPNYAKENNKTNLPYNRRAVFIKNDHKKQEYKFIGVFTCIEGTKDDMVRLYRQTSPVIDTNNFSGCTEIDLPEAYQTEED